MTEIVLEREFYLLRGFLSPKEQAAIERKLELGFDNFESREYLNQSVSEESQDRILAPLYQRVLAALPVGHSAPAELTNAQSICITYLFQPTMEPHYDDWSDWNMVITLGRPAELVLPRSRYVIRPGDIYVFNGQHKYHGIEPHFDPLTRHKERITIQYRRTLPKSLANYNQRKYAAKLKRKY